MAAMPVSIVPSDLVLATVVFLECRDAVVRSEVARCGGRIWTATPDGLMATFDAPSRAIRCMQRLRSLGLHIRAGMHAGQIAVHDHDIEGVAVRIAADVLEASRDGVVMVSRTVAELVAGSGLNLVDQGAHGDLNLFQVG
jgi:class 3 adenylate cyclase